MINKIEEIFWWTLIFGLIILLITLIIATMFDNGGLGYVTTVNNSMCSVCAAECPNYGLK